MLQTDSIKAFLTAKTHKDLADLYNLEMEVQVNAAQDNGVRTQGEYQGRTWHGWQDPVDPGKTWKSFRIPYRAKTEPEYTPKELTWPLGLHAEGIGLTGWNWVRRCSLWVAYDFDSIANHKQGLSAEELEALKTSAMAIPWVTVRKSTSGRGYHLYVFLPSVATENHTEHAALGRAVLGMLSAKTGFDFQSKVDACGGNMWVWHRKMVGTDGLKLIKSGCTLTEIPVNWKDHLEVVKGNRRKNLPRYIQGDDVDLFEELCGTRPRIKLEEPHIRVQQKLDEVGAQWWWDQDHWMMVCHTADLKRVHNELNLKGIFDTIAQGSERGADHNCMSGGTEVITFNGVRKLRDIVGTTQSLYVSTPDGMKWIESKIESFGVQKTVPIKFGNNTSIRATLNHRWCYCNNGRQGFSQQHMKFTSELRVNRGKAHGDYLPLAEFKLNTPDWEGYAHGFVFGDGWNVNCRGKETTEVAFFKNDKDLLSLFSNFCSSFGYKKFGDSGYKTVAYGLPSHWKELPKNPTRQYALGFVLGLFCADNGCQNTGSFRIAQTDYHDLKSVRELALYAGLRSRNLTFVPRGESQFENAQDSWVLTIETYNLKPEWILRSDLRASTGIKKKCHTTTVNSIDFEDVIEEEVFCPVVPSHQNFTLGNGVITFNCFAFPIRRGAWVIRRYSAGIQEHASWEQDKNGYTRCFYNQEPDLQTAARSSDGIELEKGGFVFQEAEVAVRVADQLGATIKLPTWAMNRETVVRHHKKDGRLIMQVKHEAKDNGGEMPGWQMEKGFWTRIFNVKVQAPSESEVGNYDDLVRHLITDAGEDYNWSINSGQGWQTEPIAHVKLALKSMNFGDREINNVLGNCVLRSWTVVNIPFEDEFPGDRKWNRNAAQLRFKPKIEEPFEYSTWMKVLNHCGRGLDEAVLQNEWCQIHGVKTGGDYLKIWVASVFQQPMEPLPYLFFYSEEEATGKSTFHEALSLLVNKGYIEASQAITSDGGFNGELQNAVFCVIDEFDLSKHKDARNRIKNWVTARELSVHIKGQTPYHIVNTTHWIQTANSATFCPVFPGDSRITVVCVPPFVKDQLVPKYRLFQLLEKEASDFLGAIMSVEIPVPEDRLAIPIVETQEKKRTATGNMTPIQAFIEELCFKIPGALTKFSDFYEAFVNWLDTDEIGNWSKIRVGRDLPQLHPKGRNMADGANFYIGNLSLKSGIEPSVQWHVVNNTLVRSK